jgi:hypothetical protein
MKIGVVYFLKMLVTITKFHEAVTQNTAVSAFLTAITSNFLL